MCVWAWAEAVSAGLVEGTSVRQRERGRRGGRAGGRMWACAESGGEDRVGTVWGGTRWRHTLRKRGDKRDSSGRPVNGIFRFND